MKSSLVLIVIASAVHFTAMTSSAKSRGGLASERPWAASHVEGLPSDIRRHVQGFVRACGNAAAAAHYFGTSMEASGRRFYAQHFEDFACARRAVVCRPGGCLHEVFVSDGNRQRLVFSSFARDIKLTNDGGIAGLEVIHDGAGQAFVWNGRRFVPAQKRQRDR